MQASIGKVVQVMQSVWKDDRVVPYSFTATVEDVDQAGVLRLVVHDGRQRSSDQTIRTALQDDIVAVIP